VSHYLITFADHLREWYSLESAPMITKYRVAIADGDTATLADLRSMLERAGHSVVGCVRSVEDVSKLARETAPDLVIVDITLGDNKKICAMAQIMAAREAPILALADSLDDEVIERANLSRVFGFLIKPIHEQDLFAMMTIAVNRFHEFCQLKEEASSFRDALNDRKVIERAKGILMKCRSIDEEMAFREMQHLARNHQQKLVDVAKGILIANEVLQPT
jgi:AmiR/NasT family two-component response regulator